MRVTSLIATFGGRRSTIPGDSNALHCGFLSSESQGATMPSARGTSLREESAMKVGVLGSGDVGKVLADGFLKHGHDVMMGTREPSKLADWARQNPKGRVGTFAEAAGFGELAVLA